MENDDYLNEIYAYDPTDDPALHGCLTVDQVQDPSSLADLDLDRVSVDRSTGPAAPRFPRLFPSSTIHATPVGGEQFDQPQVASVEASPAYEASIQHETVEEIEAIELEGIHAAAAVASPSCKVNGFRCARDLAEKDFAPVDYLVEDLIAAGLTNLSGAPKIGKSAFALQMASACALGHPFLGRATKRTTVVYLALEDGERRIQGRLEQAIPEGTLKPSNLHFRLAEDVAGKSLLEVLDESKVAFPDLGLAFVDTYGRICDESPKRGNLYEHDTKTVGKIQQWAMQNNVAVIFVHHTRKAKADDILHTVSGTTGLTGTADVVIVLEKERFADRATLSVIGRDTKDQKIYLQRTDSAPGPWMLSEGPVLHISDERKSVIDALEAKGPLTNEELSDATGKPPNALKTLLCRMAAAGSIVREGRGYYKLPDPKEPKQ